MPPVFATSAPRNLHAGHLLTLALLSAVAGACIEVEPKGAESPIPGESKDDSFRRPTDHGVIPFGLLVTAEITPDARFHAWTFELGDTRDLAIRTSPAFDGHEEVDTVLYLYRQRSDDRWGRYIARADDTEWGVWAELYTQLGAGTYRILVKGFGEEDLGPFGLRADAARASALRVPLLDNRGISIPELHCDLFPPDPPRDVEVTLDPTTWKAFSQWIAVLDLCGFGMTAFEPPEAYPGLCYLGDPGEALAIAATASHLFPDDLEIHAWKHGGAETFRSPGEDVGTYPDVWHAPPTEDGLLIFVYGLAAAPGARFSASVPVCE